MGICRYFGLCGGCSLQDVEYLSQVEDKRKTVSETLGHEVSDVHYGSPFGYRTRMDFVFHGGGIGFRAKGRRNEVFDVEECPISNGGVNRLLSETREAFRDNDVYGPWNPEGALKYVVFRAPPGDSSVSFVLNAKSEGRASALKSIGEYAASASAANVAAAFIPPESEQSLSLDFVTVKGSGALRESYLGRVFQYPVQGFFQNNHEVAELLHRHCNRVLASHASPRADLLDLYGGVGTFGILNADLYRAVTVVDADGPSIREAARNIAVNNAVNVKAVASDVKDFDYSGGAPTHVVVDPPRPGMHPKVVKKIAALRPGIIVYVSCNPATMKRDIDSLSGYKLDEVAFFDMFPQTPHVEAVALLSEK